MRERRRNYSGLPPSLRRQSTNPLQETHVRHRQRVEAAESGGGRVDSVRIKGRTVPVQTGPLSFDQPTKIGPSISIVGGPRKMFEPINPWTGKPYSKETGSTTDEGYLDYLSGSGGSGGGGGVEELRDQLDQFAGFRIPTWAYIAITGGIVYWWTNRKKGKK